MGLFYLLVLVLFVAVTEAEGIFFPGDLDHAEHDACTTHAESAGTCERSCASVHKHEQLRKCGIKDSAFLYCCDSTLNVKTTERITDISPPFVSFQCGRNTKNYFVFSQYDSTPLLLRPEAALSPTDVKVTSNPPPVRPGIPIEAFNDYINDDTTLPDGYYAVVLGVDAEKNSWPWMALVGETINNSTSWFCGGVLINDQWVLSALHCFINHVANVVRLGEHDYNSDYEGKNSEIDFDVVDTILYPDFKYPEAYHDLALLKLSRKVTIEDHIAPVCLPWGKESDTSMINQIATITGWGDTEYRGFPSSILQEANVTVFPVDQCDRSYSNLPHYRATWPQGMKQETLCAGDPDGGRDACQGDSGGPLVSQDVHGHFVLAGIVSRGYGCGQQDYPGLYANLRHPPHLAWIKEVAFGTP